MAEAKAKWEDLSIGQKEKCVNEYWADLTPDQKHEYLKEHYLRVTDNKSALENLNAYAAHRRDYPGDGIWASGFHKLDDKLEGGFMGGQLIVLGAISSLGKTSLALQIATQIAEQKKDVLIFSLEMSSRELNAKTISRYSYINTVNNEGLQKYRFNTNDILNGRVGTLILNQMPTDGKSRVYYEAYQKTMALGNYIRIFVGENNVDVDKIREIVDIHKEATGRDPFVICDYLQILQPSIEAQTTDKRLLTDYDVTTLKTIARDHNIPVMIISAFNRNSYLEPVSMSSFRESSGIEYSSDVLLGLQYDGMDYQKHWFKNKKGKSRQVWESEKLHKNRVRELVTKIQTNNEQSHGQSPQKIEMKILKNRNGSRGSLYFDFVPAFNYYDEINTNTSRYELSPAEWAALSDDDSLPFDNDGDESSPVVSSKNGITVSNKIL